MNEQTKKVIANLQAVAKLNDDSFTYRANIEPKHGGLVFTFSALENADKHEFVSGMGSTLEEAAEAANKDIRSACETWDYKVPKTIVD